MEHDIEKMIKECKGHQPAAKALPIKTQPKNRHPMDTWAYRLRRITERILLLDH